MIGKDTIDERIHAFCESKARLGDEVLQDGNVSAVARSRRVVTLEGGAAEDGEAKASELLQLLDQEARKAASAKEKPLAKRGAGNGGDADDQPMQTA